MSRKPVDRLYQKGGRWYADLREYRDVGGRLLALIPPGAARATEDADLAMRLLLAELERLKGLRRDALAVGEGRTRVTLGQVAREFLTEERRLIDEQQPGAVTERWLEATAFHLERALKYFQPSRPLLAIDPEHVGDWLEHLRRTVKGRNGQMSVDALRHHMHGLSKVYRYANHRRLLGHHYNPVTDLEARYKPKGGRREAQFLEVADAARLLDAARRIPTKRPDLACPCLFELVATFLLTGGRRSEVLGLTAEDVSFERGTVTFRPHTHRRLKNRGSARVVPLWPQLAEILRPYIIPADRTPRAGLLFPGEGRSGAPQMLTDFRKALTAAVTAAGLAVRVTPKVFRHSYCSSRLQTLDGGAPVSPFTVSRELGHGSREMVERIYGHLGTIRHRSEVVEYRLAAHPSNIHPVTEEATASAKPFQRP